MSPVASWFLMFSLAFIVFGTFNAMYIDSLKREIEKNKPPF